FLVCSQGSDLKSVKKYLADKLPGYMVPSRIISLESLPLTVNGKVDRRTLLDQLNNNHWQKAKRLAPESDIQKKVSEIWKSYTDAKNLGLEDTFFDAGGQSLSIIRALKEVNEYFKIELPLNVCYNMTLGQVSDEIADRIMSVTET
ncbi:MAG: phosphopantetheine-binding protein, partial [Bacteroidota bacterium]